MAANIKPRPRISSIKGCTKSARKIFSLAKRKDEEKAIKVIMQKAFAAKEKVNQISLLEPLPYEAPEDIPAEEIEVIDAENVSIAAVEVDKEKSKSTKKKTNDDLDFEIDDEGQITLF